MNALKLAHVPFPFRSDNTIFLPGTFPLPFVLDVAFIQYLRTPPVTLDIRPLITYILPTNDRLPLHRLG